MLSLVRPLRVLPTRPIRHEPTGDRGPRRCSFTIILQYTLHISPQFVARKMIHLNVNINVPFMSFCKVSFGDFAPYMIATEASLAAVNEELQSPVTMQRFRPNVVVSGLKAFEEVSLLPNFGKNNNRVNEGPNSTVCCIINVYFIFTLKGTATVTTVIPKLHFQPISTT